MKNFARHAKSHWRLAAVKHSVFCVKHVTTYCLEAVVTRTDFF